jgi:SEC-C motif domain protein
MRSRYSAFALGNSEYVLASWHPSTRPGSLELDPEVRWIRLDIIEKLAGGPFESSGIVEFEAHYRGGSQRERSRFLRERGRWYYLGAASLTDGH